MSYSSDNSTIKQKPKLLDQVRFVLRTKHYSLRTEESYVSWIKRFILDDLYSCNEKGRSLRQESCR